jgi:hypothetical protein
MRPEKMQPAQILVAVLSSQIRIADAADSRETLTAKVVLFAYSAGRKQQCAGKSAVTVMTQGRSTSLP